MNTCANKILVVDDEEKIVEVVKSYLEHAGYDVYTAYNGKQALETFERVSPALVVLDLMLPDITGEDICKMLRKQSRVPIIMVTAKVEEEDILQGLAFGADDYVTKPFSPKQLIARVSALLRRTTDDPLLLADLISYNNNHLIVDCMQREVRKNGNVVNLTPKEYRILLTMIKYPKKTFTREELIFMAMGEDFDGYDRTVDTHIKNLRSKVEVDPKTPNYILTVHGVGYRFGGEKNEI
ncbi:MAG: DNA-binding response regulator [Firmicutes bacterium HGW-Firmicutes-1]|jgi:DNA-binding response OmpR family regulator|nr:MAG: DNA-binding response regulator [Firmicutes bacterium HGW-Firmicutes-1]